MPSPNVAFRCPNEDCDEPVPEYSKSPYYCDACFGWRVADKRKEEMNQALKSIARGIDKVDAAIEKISDMTVFKRQAE